jgi:signal transduction histidine kinase
MSTRRFANLRNVLSLAAVVVAVLVVTAAVALVIATRVLANTRTEIAASVESVRTIEEAEVNMLLHVRSEDDGARKEFQNQIRSLLDDAARYVTSPEETRALGNARVEVERYLEDANDASTSEEMLHARETAAIAALERLVDIDVAHTRAAQARALQWTQVASFAGIAFGIAIIVITLALVLWLRRRVLRPLFGLANTLKQFGEGKRTVRADEEGPTELREMAQRFNEMADSIAAQRQAQVAFLGGVAHDLKNPLSALKLAVEMVEPTAPLPPEPRIRRTLDVISRQIDQLDRMVGDFLDMAKIEAGELALHIEPHDIRQVVRSSFELFDETTRSRFRITLPDEPIVVACDGVRIGQAVTNLISNAVKYSPKDQPVRIVVIAYDDDVAIEVTDRGVGIPDEDHERIFAPFQRGRAAKSDVAGTGLGLFNVQRIVQAHRGRIELESEPQKGSTFRIWLARVDHVRSDGSVGNENQYVRLIEDV